MHTSILTTDSERIIKLVEILPEESFLEYLGYLENYDQLSVYLIEDIDKFFSFRNTISGKFDNPATEKNVLVFERKLHELCDVTESISFPVEGDLQHRFLKVESSRETKTKLNNIITSVRNEYRAILHRSLQKPRNETRVLTYSHGTITYENKKMSLESSNRIALMDLLWSSRAISKIRATSISFEKIVTITDWSLTNIRGNIKSFNDDLAENNLPLKFAFHKNELVLLYRKNTKTL
jgi:hypothetical protein